MFVVFIWIGFVLLVVCSNLVAVRLRARKSSKADKNKTTLNSDSKSVHMTFRELFEPVDSDWLSKQRKSEEASRMKLYQSEGLKLRDEHHQSCDALQLRTLHSTNCASDWVEQSTSRKLTQEEMDARKAELKRRLGR